MFCLFPSTCVWDLDVDKIGAEREFSCRKMRKNTYANREYSKNTDQLVSYESEG